MNETSQLDVLRKCHLLADLVQLKSIRAGACLGPIFDLYSDPIPRLPSRFLPRRLSSELLVRFRIDLLPSCLHTPTFSPLTQTVPRDTFPVTCAALYESAVRFTLTLYTSPGPIRQSMKVKSMAGTQPLAVVPRMYYDRSSSEPSGCLCYI